MFKFNGRHKEDKFLYENIFYNVKNKIFLEIGACDGLMASNTLFFEKQLNWNGILIEANPYQYKHLLKNRPNNKLFTTLVSDITSPCEYQCISNEAVSGVVSTLPESHNAFFSKDNEHSYWRNKEKKIVRLQPRTMQSILDETNIHKIDLFSLDVEGHELNVLKSIDFSKNIINVILVEMLNTNNELEKIRDFLKEKNYNFYAIVGRNEVYILNTFNEISKITN